MSLISLHRKYFFIDYQNHLCSSAAFITFFAILASVILPFVWIKTVNNEIFSSDYIVAYEQPMVKFQFKYIAVMEHAMEAETKVILCSLFDVLNNQEGNSGCAKVKIIEKDVNFDGIPDEIQFTLGFGTMFGYGVKSLSLVMFLDTRLEQKCSLNIPSAVVINKKLFPNNLNDRKIVISGSLRNQQNHALVCPFFLRNVKSHFFNENLAKNETSLDKLSISRIKDNLERNPMHFRFQESSTDFEELDTESSSIKIKLRIPEVPIRYKKTFWKAVNDVWINYIAIFVVTFVVCNFLLNHLFENRILMARKKSSLKAKEI